MEINVKIMQGVTVVEMAGDLRTWQEVPQAQERLLAAAQADGKMILDMRGVEFMNSAGLRMLLTAYRAVTGKGGRVLVVGLSPRIKDIMETTGFLDFFPQRDTVEAGVAELTSGSGLRSVRPDGGAEPPHRAGGA